MNAQYPYHVLVLALTLLLQATQTVYASETPWQEVAPGAQLRFISSNSRSADGHVQAAVQIRMQPGLKTYWRIPGETGIPMRLDWQGSHNIAEAKFSWPFPKRTMNYGMMDYVLEGDVTVPLNLMLSDQDANAKLVATLNLGICSDICIPVRWQGQMYIDLAKPVRANQFRIEAAYAHVPLLDERANAPFERIGFDAEQNQLVLRKTNDPATNLSLIVDLPKTTLLFDLPHSGPESEFMTVASLTDFDLSTLINKTIRLTYDSADGPYTKLVEVEELQRVDGVAVFR